MADHVERLLGPDGPVFMPAADLLGLRGFRYAAPPTPVAHPTPTCRWGGKACDEPPGDDGLCPHHRARRVAWRVR